MPSANAAAASGGSARKFQLPGSFLFRKKDNGGGGGGGGDGDSVTSEGGSSSTSAGRHADASRGGAVHVECT